MGISVCIFVRTRAAMISAVNSNIRGRLDHTTYPAS
jgi:hypothetical protein